MRGQLMSVVLDVHDLAGKCDHGAFDLLQLRLKLSLFVLECVRLETKRQLVEGLIEHGFLLLQLFQSGDPFILCHQSSAWWHACLGTVFFFLLFCVLHFSLEALDIVRDLSETLMLFYRLVVLLVVHVVDIVLLISWTASLLQLLLLLCFNSSQ